MVAGYNMEQSQTDTAYVSDCAKDHKGSEGNAELDNDFPMSAWTTCSGTDPETVLSAIRDNADRRQAKEDAVVIRKDAKAAAKGDRQAANDVRSDNGVVARDAASARKSAREAAKEAAQAALATSRGAKLGQYAAGGPKEDEALDKENERHAALIDKLDKQRESKTTRAETQVSRMGDASRKSHTDKANEYLQAEIEKNVLLDLKRDQKKSLDAVRAERKTKKESEKAEAKAIRDAIVAGKKKK
jgi:hypothetical protein